MKEEERKRNLKDGEREGGKANKKGEIGRDSERGRGKGKLRDSKTETEKDKLKRKRKRNEETKKLANEKGEID
jgi:hypothetical protein